MAGNEHHIEQYLPDRLAEIKEAMSLCLAENPEFDLMDELRIKWETNRFPLEADADGLRAWEGVLDLYPKDGDSLEDRRDRVVAKLNSRVPYTEIQLRRMLAAIVGWGNFELQILGFELYLWVALRSDMSLETLYDILIEVVPEHIWISFARAAELLTKSMAAASKQKTWIDILPWQERLVRSRADVGVGAAGWGRNFIDVLPYQPQLADLRVIPPGAAQKSHTTVTIGYPQIHEAETRTPVLAAACYTARQVITIPAGQQAFWRRIDYA